nr:hypothetical protein BaRGS_015752 [Batillaria attramentaria]
MVDGDALVNFKDQSFVGSDGHEECSFCSGGWWVEKVNFCCGDTPNSPLNGEALWASHDDFYLEKFQILIKRVKE